MRLTRPGKLPLVSGLAVQVSARQVLVQVRVEEVVVQSGELQRGLELRAGVLRRVNWSSRAEVEYCTVMQRRRNIVLMLQSAPEAESE